MKNSKFILLFIIITALIHTCKSSAAVPDSVIYENDSVFTIEQIKEELSSEGEWIKVSKAEIDPEGVKSCPDDVDDDINTDYIWRPYNFPDGWSPYTYGYWRYTNCGWMWFSHYSWGWRPYHYGRWWWSPVWGWVWSPGFIWAPAWVVWMFWDDYCGWYPISPRVRRHKFYGWQCYNMRYRVKHWTFCNTHNLNGVITPTVIIDPAGNKEIIDKSKFISDINITKNGVINRGPDITQVEKYTGEKTAIENVTKYNNTRVDDTKVKRDEQVNYKQKKQDQEINKDSEKQKKNDREINKETEKQKNSEREPYTPPKENNEKKSGDNEKKEYKKEKKETYTPPYDNRNDEGSNRNSNPPKKESPPPPVKKNDEGNKSNDSNKGNSETDIKSQK